MCRLAHQPDSPPISLLPRRDEIDIFSPSYRRGLRNVTPELLLGREENTQRGQMITGNRVVQSVAIDSREGRYSET